MRLAVLQRVCPSYRVALFKALSDALGKEFCVFIGEDLPNSKVKSTSHVQGVNVQKLRTRFFKFGRRILPWHIGLVSALERFDPDVILCEGESHFLGYLQAIYYRYRYKKTVALMHWCFTCLPGESPHRSDIAALTKAYFRKYFDAFVTYSSFSKDRLRELDIPSERIFVATNVGEVTRFLKASDDLQESKEEAQQRLGLPARFTVLFVGTLDWNKRPGLLLEIARMPRGTAYNFVIIGTGPELEALTARVTTEGLTNVFLRGRVGSVEELARYYRAAEVLIVPGRGGIVMSEALAAALPVIVHQADGTEYDLVEHGLTGLRVNESSAQGFAEALDLLRTNPTLVLTMGSTGRRRMSDQFDERAMVRNIVAASQYAAKARLSTLSRAENEPAQS